MGRYDFTYGESDNALYYAKIKGMREGELIQEYKELMQSRGEGGDLSYNIQMCLDILKLYAEAMFVVLPQLPQDKTIRGYIMEIETPESSSVSGYGYDFFTETLYVRYRKNSKVYEFNNIKEPKYKEFLASDSKGSFVSNLKKEIKK